MAKLLVHKKGYVRKAHHRKGYVRKDGVRVKPTKVKASKVSPTTYEMVDRGARGRGKKIIPTLKRGTLGVDFSKPAKERRKQEIKLAKKIGEKKVVSKLIALEVLNKRVNPSLAKKAKADAHFIAGSFKGKKQVEYPKGFCRSE